MSATPRAQSPLTPPGVSRVFFSFTHSRSATDSTPRAKPSIEPIPPLDFDAGIKTSAAWTEHLDSDTASRSLSDDEGDDPPEEDEDGRGARVLFQFEGRPEFRELDAKAGDEIEVIREEAGDGWSLVRNRNGEMGLLPRSYYTFTIDFISAPDTVQHGHNASSSRRDASAASLTPRGSPARISAPLPAAQPIVVQTTGERMMAAFPSFRQSLLGGKNLNRFSSFVTSGAEAYVLKGTTEPTDTMPASLKHAYEASDEGEDEETEAVSLGVGEAKVRSRSEADRHFVDAGPSWRSKVPPFRILVHSPSKRTSTLSGSYTVYTVTSLFHLPSSDDESELDSVDPSDSPSRITVHRRFSHFVVLHTALTRRLPGIALPPLPEKQYAGRFNDDFVEARRGDLERYLAKIVRHPVARYAEILTFFLGCESDIEWKRQLPRHLGLPPAGPSFYANVYHPDFNFDAEEAVETIDRFEAHTKSVGAGVQGLRNNFGQIRQARIEMSKAERILSYSLLSLITSKPLVSSQNGSIAIREEEPEYDSDEESDSSSQDRLAEKKNKGYLNEEGAWCWRESCPECLRLTKALQKTSETLQSVADLYDDHARRTQLATHDALKGVAHPSPLYAPVIDTHRNALSRYTEATHGEPADDEMASRCETVINTTMAEMETYHTQKLEDFTSIAKEHLDGEIEFYEQVLSRLRTARRTFEPPIYPRLDTGPRQASIYERELEHPRLTPDQLPQPCPHVFDSTPMRPVSQAIQEGVGMLLGGATNAVAGRASVFGRFW
ncbi:hypothetical protein BV25DRAFT_1819910 [Artomyces pyxidatus]|uniref:Uncharacterized protein n=1 Tax=Artomyces pyxidatus TaxID=48021 RepID=A0ACB8TEG2_9AGAM|nr:hypothetical protein BV25DRAFT_1819910 [Artomyces pyxidatus]